MIENTEKCPSSKKRGDTLETVRHPGNTGNNGKKEGVLVESKKQRGFGCLQRETTHYMVTIAVETSLKIAAVERGLQDMKNHQKKGRGMGVFDSLT